MKKRILTAVLAALVLAMPAAETHFPRLPSFAARAEASGLLTETEIRLPALPAAGDSPTPDLYTVSEGTLSMTRWIDMAEKRPLGPDDRFSEGHVCSFSAYIDAPDDSGWAVTSDGYPKVRVTCTAGEETTEATSVMFNPNADGSVTLLAVFVFTVRTKGTIVGHEDPDEQGETTEPSVTDEPADPSVHPESGEITVSPPEPEDDGPIVRSAVVRGARVPGDGAKMQSSGWDASPCTVRDCGWYNVTDARAMKTGETFVGGKEYDISLFLLPPDGKEWAEEVSLFLELENGTKVSPSRCFFQTEADGTTFLIGDFILTAMYEGPVRPVQPETPKEEDKPSETPGSTGAVYVSLSITQEPSDLAAVPGSSVLFRAGCGDPNAVCRWVAMNGDTLIPLSDGLFGYGSKLSGTATAELTIGNVSEAFSGLSFFCIFTDREGVTLSTRAALLTVGAAPDPEPSFTDVGPDDWYFSSAERASSLGLMNGRGSGKFVPDGTLTYAEAVKLAACIRQRVLDGAVSLQNGDPWYAPYIDYAAETGILTDTEAEGTLSAADIYAAANDPVNRSAFAWIFSRALPEGTLPAVNEIPEGSIPDVTEPGERSAAVYILYRAGIMNGSDRYGTFRPDAAIKRSEVAAVAVRMILSEERVGAPESLGGR